MIKGARINNADILNEEYMISDNWIIANINADRILKVINEFVDMQKDPLFLIIEVPTNIDNEKIKDNGIYQIHKDVYYLDNISISYAKELDVYKRQRLHHTVSTKPTSMSKFILSIITTTNRNITISRNRHHRNI